MTNSCANGVWRSGRLGLVWLLGGLVFGHAAALTTVTNTATISPPVGVADASGGCDGAVPPNCTGNNISTASTNVWAPTTSKNASPPSGTPVVPGSLISYTLTVNVTGAASTAAVVLNDTLGAGLSFGSVTSNAGGFTANTAANPLVFSLPAGAAVGPHTLQYTATVNTGATGTVTNSVVGGANCTPAVPCSASHPIGAVTLAKALTAQSGSQAAFAEPGETLTYTLTLTNAGGSPAVYSMTDTLSAGLTYVSSSPGGVNSGQATTWANLSVPANGTLSVVVVATVDTPIAGASVGNLAKQTGQPDPACPGAACVTTPTAAYVKPLKLLTGETGSQPQRAEAGETLTYTITLTNSGGTAFANYRLTENIPVGATLVGVNGASGFSGPVTGGARVDLVVPSVPPLGAANVTVQFRVSDPIPAGVTDLMNLIDGGDVDPACATACRVGIPIEIPAQLSVVKSVAVREARIGDLVRYAVRIANIGTVDVRNATLVDTPPPGFSYVAGSMAVADGDGAFALGASQYPLQIGGIDIAVGKDAVVSYLLRVGAGVRQGVHANQALAQNSRGRVVSNVATAQVTVVGDPMLDESLILGTVFDDRDGDGWQDPAHLSGVRVQGGFAPGAYIANSTTVDRGLGPEPAPDASAPMLHGIAVGRISGRQSEADPVENHQVVIRQRLSGPDFTDDFVLTSDQGITVRMDAAGRTTVEKSGDAARGLNAAAPTVERRVVRVPDGHAVDYVIRNAGIDERGIPGVRIASVEGLLVETDLYGRYNLTGIAGGNWVRGRNFILKLDPSTLPKGALFTTANPLVRRITPGVPVRFDFGVKLPVERLGADPEVPEGVRVETVEDAPPTASAGRK